MLFIFSLFSSGERSLWASPHNLPPRSFRWTVLLPTRVCRRWSFRSFFRFSFCFCEDIRAADWGFFSSKRLSAGSEEDLDEEGLGRRAVTPQVVGTYGAQWLPLSTSSCLTCLLISRRRSMWDRVGRPCPWWSRSWPRRRTGSLRKTMWVPDSAPIEPPLSGWRVSTSCGLVQRQFTLLNLCCWCNWSK